ncbi:MAG: ATP-binding protein [Alphaproteobacteria bacterium]|nr:ATP-binding protein [Alphaproteobacteria bacterium]
MRISDLTGEYLDIYNRYCIPVADKVVLDNVILSEENSKKLKEFLLEYSNRYKFKNFGMTTMNKLLFYGATGTGKTYLAKAISNHYSLPMLQIDVSKLPESNLALALTEIFQLSRVLGSAVIFLDECDSICWARDDVNNQDSASVRRANNTLFQLLNELDADSIFISATNLYDNLDVAFVRRFDLKFRFIAPTIDRFDEAVEKFVDKSRFKYISDMDENVKEIVNYQVQRSLNLSYAQIKGWIQQIEKSALIKDENSIKESSFYELLMRDMRIAVKYDSSGVPYLYQYGVQSM